MEVFSSGEGNKKTEKSYSCKLASMILSLHLLFRHPNSTIDQNESKLIEHITNYDVNQIHLKVITVNMKTLDLKNCARVGKKIFIIKYTDC